MSNARNTGGAPLHEPGRDSVDRPAADAPRGGGGVTSPREARLEDPTTPHKSPSAREERRAAEREAAREAEREATEETGS